MTNPNQEPDAAASIRALLADRVRLYMAERMAMTEPLDDQEQNWIYSHMTECALEALLASPPPVSPSPQESTNDDLARIGQPDVLPAQQHASTDTKG